MENPVKPQKCGIKKKQLVTLEEFLGGLNDMTASNFGIVSPHFEVFFGVG